ncbi:hypothetical protein E4L96_04665, partial [Massilia arenosa]
MYFMQIARLPLCIATDYAVLMSDQEGSMEAASKAQATFGDGDIGAPGGDDGQVGGAAQAWAGRGESGVGVRADGVAQAAAGRGEAVVGTRAEGAAQAGAARGEAG